LERLGWSFVAKARESFDPGFYTLAEQSALCLESRQPNAPEALLLRGHALHNMHGFKEAEPLARELVAKRGLPADFGLLGDVLMEQGQLNEAVEAYQTMLDLKPDLHAYARAAHVRWLKGDLEGAVELMQVAASASSPQTPEPSAWVHTRLAALQFQAGAIQEAEQTCAAALELQRNYAPALLLRGRIRLSKGKAAEALEPLRRAATLNPLAEYQWLLAEALYEAGRADEALAVEKQLREHGADSDPRTFALFLATRGESPGVAVAFAEHELSHRADVFTHDALAWSLSATGKMAEAQREMQLALADGTVDARLFFHATIIAAKSGYREEARRWLHKAQKSIHGLLPSEAKQLQFAALELERDSVADRSNSSRPQTFSTAGN